MKLGKVLALSAAVAALGFVGCSAEEDGYEEVEFHIAGQFEACVRDTLKNYETPLTFEEVKTIGALECQDYGITSLEGIQWFHGLRKLSMWENEISDITPLASIPALEYVELGNNQISDITPLAGMPNLARLGLALNDIADVSPLASLPALRWLELDHNGLTDAAVSTLCSLGGLTWLSVEHNNLSSNHALDCLQSENVYAEYQGENNRSARTSASAIPSWLTMPRSAGVAPAGELDVGGVDGDGRVSFRYVTDDASYPVHREFAGEVVLRGTTLVYRTRTGEVAVGTVAEGGAELCTGAYADVCSAGVGKKGPWDGSQTAQRDAEPAPVFSLALDVFALDSSRFRDAAPYGAVDEELLPYAMSAPNQLDAGSCLFMATTGAMELLLNQHGGLDQMAHQGDTDLSERYLMAAYDDVPLSAAEYYLTDLSYTFNYIGGAMLDRDYPFVVGYVRESGNSIVPAESGDDGAYLSASYNWFDERPADWQSKLVSTPTVERTPVYVDPLRDDNSQWRVGLMGTDQVNLIKHQLLNKRAPVIVVYNHYLYWHAVMIVGYDDEADSGGCPMVEGSIDYYREQGADSYASKVESAMARNGGCTNKGIFYVRDSIYDGAGVEDSYSYGGTYNEPYSLRIITHSYNWVRYLANHAYVIYRQ